jgi:DNA-binding NtrC family response regulator
VEGSVTQDIVDVLVVDDEQAVRGLVARWLDEAGYRVRSVSSADEAMAVLRDGGPRVLVTDLQMPGHDGVWLARQLRATCPAAALVVVTGDESGVARLARAGVGAFDYLAKPFTRDAVLEAVDRGARWHEERFLERPQAPAGTTRVAPGVWTFDPADEPYGWHWVPDAPAAERLRGVLELAGV